MRNVSKQFYTTMEERRDFYPSAEITFSDGQKKTLGKDEMYISGNTIVESAETSSFPLGQFAARRITLSIINDDDRWSVYNFAWAKIVLKTKFELLDGTTETINIGTYTVATPEAYGTTITVTAIDDSYRCDKEYDTALTYPITVSEALLDSCATCGITLLSSHFNNSDYVIPSKPTNLTHRQFIGYCAMLAGGNAAMDENNRLIIKTYDFSDFTKSSDEWGGVFDVLSDERYMTGDDISCGVFSPWDVGEVEDPAFSDLKNVNVLNNFGSGITVDVDYVVITGVQMSSGSDVYLYGQEGYVLSLDFPLAKGKEAEAVERIGQRIVGLKFRPFSGQYLAYPIAEFLDLAYVTDRNGRAYQTVLTDVDFSYFGYTALKCVADSPIRNSSTYYGNEVKAIIKAREESEELINQYDKAMSALNGLIANSLGLFTTTKYTESGGRIEYQHDKPTLEESEKIWEKSEAGFRVSTDGGKTWNAGMDASGNAVLNALSVIGITFDWARGGTLVIGGPNEENGIIQVLNSSSSQNALVTSDGFSSSYTYQGNAKRSLLGYGDLRFYRQYYTLSGTVSCSFMGDDDLAGLELTSYTGTIAFNTNSPLPRYIITDVQGGLIGLGNHEFWGDGGFNGSLLVQDDLTVRGEKNRLVKTKNYSEHLLHSYETAFPLFGNIGNAKTDENGFCYVSIDGIFLETARTDISYYVFLQKEGQGNIWVESKEASYFVVKGTPNLLFSWEIKAVQNGYEMNYLGSFFDRANSRASDNSDLEKIFSGNLKNYELEMEGIFNENLEGVSSN